MSNAHDWPGETQRGFYQEAFLILAPKYTKTRAEQLAQEAHDVPGKLEAARLALHHGKVRAAYWKRNAEDVIRARRLRMMALAAALGVAAGLMYHHRPHMKEVCEPDT